MNLAPITLFVYKRVDHLIKTVAALKNNDLATESELIIFSDGPKGKFDSDKVKEVREYIKKIDGFKRLQIIEREKNFGLANNIIEGVTEVVNNYGRIIVLEDDLVISPYFLRFMNSALNIYEKENRVISIHGYVYNIKGLPETFFLRGADCWGWATWKRGWDLFEKDGEKLLTELKKKKLTREFDFNGGYPYTKMLEKHIKGKNDSWAIRWYASAFLKEMLTLYPGKSYVQHIGYDYNSSNARFRTKFLDTEIKKDFTDIEKIEIKENIEARRKIEKFLSNFTIRYRIEVISNIISESLKRVVGWKK